MYSVFSLPGSLLLLLLSSSVSAKTDLTGCTTTDLTSPAGASQAWYVPGTGELCDFLDCGGGMAPPKLNVPGCAAYTGTETYSPSFLAGYTAAATAQQTSSPAVETTTTSLAESAHTESTETDWSMPTTTTGFDTTVTGISATVDPSNRPLICALQASSDPNCGISWSTTTSYTTTSTNTVDDSSADSTITSSPQVSSGAVASASQTNSMTLSLVRTVPNSTATATSSSAISASTGGATTIKEVASGLGLLVAAFGGLAML